MEPAGERRAIVLHRTLKLVLTRRVNTAGLSLPRAVVRSEEAPQTSGSVRAAATGRVGRSLKRIAANEKPLAKSPVPVGDSHETETSDRGIKTSDCDGTEISDRGGTETSDCDGTETSDHGGTKTSDCGGSRNIRLNRWNPNSSSGVPGTLPTPDVAGDMRTRQDMAPQPAQLGGSESCAKCVSVPLKGIGASLISDGVCASNKVSLTASPGPASSGLRSSLQTSGRRTESRKTRVVKPKAGRTAPSEPRRGTESGRKKNGSVAAVGSSGDDGGGRKRKRKRSGLEETPPAKRRKTMKEVHVHVCIAGHLFTLYPAYIAPQSRNPIAILCG